jgi:hypothetical protein
MREPRRLLDDPNGSAMARALLASAQSDAPSSAGRVRTARRLGILAVLAAGTGLGSEAGALAVTGKLAAVVLALGAVVGLAASQSPPPVLEDPPAQHDRQPARVAHAADRASAPSVGASPASPASQTMPTTPAMPAISEPAPPAVASKRTSSAPARPAARVAAPAQPAPPAPTAEPAPAPVPDEVVAAAPGAAPERALPEPAGEPAPPATEPAPAATQPASPSRLAEQVALVDRARDRLAASDPRAALAALAEYHQRFASGDLDAEADVVTIESLIALGEPVRARALGAAFLERFPRSPLAQRVRSLLERLPH